MLQILCEYPGKMIEDMGPGDFLFASKRAKSDRAYQMHSIFASCAERAIIAKRVMRYNAAHASLDAATIQMMGEWKTDR